MLETSSDRLRPGRACREWLLRFEFDTKHAQELSGFRIAILHILFHQTAEILGPGTLPAETDRPNIRIHLCREIDRENLTVLHDRRHQTVRILPYTSSELPKVRRAQEQEPTVLS